MDSTSTCYGDEVSTVLVHARALTRRFGEAIAVDGLDLELRAGEVLGLLGHNGAGKTTTIRLLTGLLRAHGGEARVMGLDPQRQGAALRGQVGVLTEGAAVDGRLTPRELLRAHARLHDAEAQLPAAIAESGLSAHADARISELSKGMKRRVALARALLPRPPVLMLDEPVSALDPVAAREVYAVIRRRVDQGAGVLLCTHNLVEAERVCDRVLVLERGRTLAQGPLAALISALGQALHVELHPEDMDRAQALLGPRVERADPGRLVLRDVDRHEVPAILQRCVGAGLRVYAVEPKRPSLEALYFQLHAREDT